MTTHVNFRQTLSRGAQENEWKAQAALVSWVEVVGEWVGGWVEVGEQMVLWPTGAGHLMCGCADRSMSWLVGWFGHLEGTLNDAARKACDACERVKAVAVGVAAEHGVDEHAEKPLLTVDMGDDAALFAVSLREGEHLDGVDAA